MGIDACMLVRYQGKERPTDEQLTRWSWDLCNSIGADKFFINDGLPPKEYKEKSGAWLAAFRAHQLYERFISLPHGEERSKVHVQIFETIGEPPKERRRALQLCNEQYPLDDYYYDEYQLDRTKDYVGKLYTQDGDPIYAEDGEWFIEVSLWTRYYGIGYERGDLLTICAVAEWLEANLSCSVWYGGDSGGALAEPFGPAERHALKRHMYSKQGREYYEQFQQRGTFPTPKPCGLCVPGEPRFNRNGWGNSYIAVSCGGCGKRFQSTDDGKTWTEEKQD